MLFIKSLDTIYKTILTNSLKTFNSYNCDEVIYLPWGVTLNIWSVLNSRSTDFTDDAKYEPKQSKTNKIITNEVHGCCLLVIN